MEVQFESAVQAKLEKIARESGLDAVQLVQDAVAGYVDELAGTREMLDSCYDDIKSGTVKLIPGDEVEATFEKGALPRAGLTDPVHDRVRFTPGRPGKTSTRFGNIFAQTV